MGTLEDLPQLSELTGAKVLVVASPRRTPPCSPESQRLPGPLGIHAKCCPIDDLLKGVSEVSDLRDLSIEDLLGRRPVDNDVESIAGYLTGKGSWSPARAARSARSCVARSAVSTRPN